MSSKRPDLDEFTIDQLAARAKMTVRNVRAYASRGFIEAPRLEGRTGFYNHEHLQRLLLIRELLNRGYTLGAVEKTLKPSPQSTSGHALELLKVMHQPSAEEEPEETTRGALAALAGVEQDDALIESLETFGLVTWIDDDRVLLNSPAVVRAGAAASALGLDPSTVIALLPLLQEHLGSIAEAFVSRVRDEIWQPFEDANMPATEWPAIVHAIETLLPVASQAVLGVFRQELAESVQSALGDKIAESEPS